MDREEILKRGKERKGKDEGEQYIESQSRRYGEIGLSLFFILLLIYKWCKGLPTNDILGLFWGYVGVSYIYKYKFSKTKSTLISAICGMIAALAFTLSYILQTW